jgi:peroxiredoxin Q/BCP
VRDEIEQFERAGVQPFGVNPATVPSHQRYAQKFRFNFPLLSDTDRSVTAAYGALKPDRKGVIRTVVLVGRDGSVLFAERGAPKTARIVAPVSPASLR